MYYIEEKEDKFIKYEVIIDKEKLEKIKYKILINCGEIKHHSYKSDYGPRIESYDHITNYSATKVGQKEYFEETRDLFLYEYDEYLDTELVKLIDRLLSGDMSAIFELKNPPEQKTNCENEDKLKVKLKELLSKEPVAIDTRKLEQVKISIEEYQLHKKLNKNQKSDSEYYPQVIACIEMIEVDTIKIDDIIKLENLLNKLKPFFNNTAEKSIHTIQYQKTIKKICQ